MSRVVRHNGLKAIRRYNFLFLRLYDKNKNLFIQSDKFDKICDQKMTVSTFDCHSRLLCHFELNMSRVFNELIVISL